ncbi:MAG: hypothetical protein H6740_07515 [Alphaproteobacteria bacterium]|nr:hypothetical protein [Alphaproteobacteria bacterium]
MPEATRTFAWVEQGDALALEADARSTHPVDLFLTDRLHLSALRLSGATGPDAVDGDRVTRGALDLPGLAGAPTTATLRPGEAPEDLILDLALSEASRLEPLFPSLVGEALAAITPPQLEGSTLRLRALSPPDSLTLLLPADAGLSLHGVAAALQVPVDGLPDASLREATLSRTPDGGFFQLELRGSVQGLAFDLPWPLARLTLDAVVVTLIRSAAGAPLTWSVLGSGALAGRAWSVTLGRESGAWTFVGSALLDVELSLASWLGEVGVEVPEGLDALLGPADSLRLTQLSLSHSPSGTRASAALQATLNLQVVGARWEFFTRLRVEGGPTRLTLEGWRRTHAGGEMSMSVALDEATTWQGCWMSPEGSPTTLAHVLDDLGLELPLDNPVLDLGLRDLRFELTPASRRFTASADTEEGGVVLAIAPRPAGGWDIGVAFVPDGGQVAADLGDEVDALLREVERALPISEEALLLTTGPLDIELPAFAARLPLPQGPGVSVAANVDLRGSRLAAVAPLRTFTALERFTLVASAAQATSSAGASASLEAQLDALRIGAGPVKLELAQPLLSVASVQPLPGAPSELAFSALGGFDLSLDAVTLRGAARVSFAPPEVSGDLSFPLGGWTAPVGLAGVHWKKVWGLLGATETPPAATTGLSATFSIGDDPEAHTLTAVVDWVDGAPDVVVLAADNLDLSLSLLLVAVLGAGHSAPSSLELLRVQDLSFWWAQRAGVPLPGGGLSRPGWAADGELALGPLTGALSLDVDANLGWRGRWRTAPISAFGGMVRVSTAPSLDVTVSSSPSIRGTWGLGLGGLAERQAEVRWQDGQLQLRVGYAVLNQPLDMTGSYNADGVSLSGSVSFDLNGSVKLLDELAVYSPLPFDDVRFNATVRLTAGGRFSIGVSGSFHYAGETLHVSLTLGADFPGFYALHDAVMGEIQRRAQELFDFLLGPARAAIAAAREAVEREKERMKREAQEAEERARRDAEAWAAAARQQTEDARQTAEDASATARHVAQLGQDVLTDPGKAVDDAKAAANSARDTAKDVTNSAEHAARAAGEQAERTAKDIAKEGQQAIDDAKERAKQAVDNAKAAAKAAKEAGEKAAKAAKEAEEAAQGAIDDAAKVAGAIGSALASGDVLGALGDLGGALGSVGEGLASLGSDLATTISTGGGLFSKL